MLVLGTLWPEYAGRYTQLPRPGGPDPHSRTRELLAGRTLAVPDAFDDDAVRAARCLAESGDQLLADTLTRARISGRIAQDLAGGPELLRRYGEATAPARALLEVGVDARRLGLGLHLPWAFLVDAAAGYLGDDDWDTLDEDWAEAAFAELAEPVHGKHAPLRRVGRPQRHPAGAAVSSAAAGPVFRLADYLEQHGRNERRRVCPPASFWEAAAHTTTPEELTELAQAARIRGRYRHAALLYRQAADAGNTGALWDLAQMREEAGDRDSADRYARQAADASDTAALRKLARLRDDAGDRIGAERHAPHANYANSTGALLWGLARMREKAGDHDDAERLYRQAADAGETRALWDLRGPGRRGTPLPAGRPRWQHPCAVGPHADTGGGWGTRRRRTLRPAGRERRRHQHVVEPRTDTGEGWGPRRRGTPLPAGRRRWRHQWAVGTRANAGRGRGPRQRLTPPPAGRRRREHRCAPWLGPPHRHGSVPRNPDPGVRVGT